MARRSGSDESTSALRVTQRVFTAATAEPTNLVLYRHDLPAEVHQYLPADRMLLRPLRDLLLARQTPLTVRDAVWRELIDRARADRSTWLVMALGMAMPGLRREVRTLSAQRSGDREDLESALVEGFVCEVNRVDTSATALCARLLRAAHRAGVRQVYQDAAARGAAWSQFASCAPRAPWGHPDFVLLDAVRTGIIRPREAWLIGITRLEGVGIGEVAAGLGERTNTVVARRHRAERHLREAILAGTVTCGADLDAHTATLLAPAACLPEGTPGCAPESSGVSRPASHRRLTRAPFEGARSPARPPDHPTAGGVSSGSRSGRPS
ncbi:MAG: hypothetical protein JXA67_02895 [Micromonosporaceae bacterium]|nr:hypothetical protein [Micromonosporaceae bacterium]